MVSPCTAAISASSPFSIGASLTAFQYSPSTKILPLRESIGVNAVTVFPTSVSFPTFTGNNCARTPFPMMKMKNAAVTSVAGMMKFNDKRKNGSAVKEHERADEKCNDSANCQHAVRWRVQIK